MQAGNIEDADKLFLDAVKALDQAGSKRIIHKNAAARKKSRLSAMIRKLKESESAKQSAVSGEGDT